MLLNSTVHPDRPRSRSSQEPLRLWPSKSCEILGVSGEKPGLTWTNPYLALLIAGVYNYCLVYNYN